MGKKQNIVVVSEFTNKSNSSKGGSINRYISEYMARDDATNVYYPLNKEPFIRDENELSVLQTSTRKRRKSVEDTIKQGGSIDDIRKHKDFHKAIEGVAFGSRGISYTEEEIRESADEFQSYFEDEHTIFKTVISFRTEYLKEMNVLPKDFFVSGQNSLQGKADQLKLRIAIEKGVQNLEKRAEFNELDWIATLQFDTNHVHAHLVFTETSDVSKRKHHFNKYTKKLEEKGKLSSYELMSIRTGIERAMQQEKEMIPYTSQENDLKHELHTYEQEVEVRSDISKKGKFPSSSLFTYAKDEEEAMSVIESSFEKKKSLPLQSTEYISKHLRQLAEMKFLEKSKKLFKKAQIELAKLRSRINGKEEIVSQSNLYRDELEAASNEQKKISDKQAVQSNEQIKQFCDVILKDGEITNTNLLKAIYALRDNPNLKVKESLFKAMNTQLPKYYQGVGGKHLKDLFDTKKVVSDERTQNTFIQLAETVENASMNAFKNGEITVDEYVDKKTALLIIQGNDHFTHYKKTDLKTPFESKNELKNTTFYLNNDFEKNLSVWIDQTSWTKEKTEKFHHLNSIYIKHIQNTKLLMEQEEQAEMGNPIAKEEALKTRNKMGELEQENGFGK